MLHFLTPLLLLAPTAAQSAPPNPEWNCANPDQQQEMNWCAAQEFARIDAELNRQWAETSAAMKTSDASWEEGFTPDWDERPGWYESLLEAQRAWLTYRDAHCRLDGYAARGGSLEPLLRATCMTELTQARIEQLRLLSEKP